MRLVIDLGETHGIDRGVALRRREAGMAEQFLNRAQIGALGEKMRREAMAEGMGRCVFVETQQRP
jgi:hypothetical protein